MTVITATGLTVWTLTNVPNKLKLVLLTTLLIIFMSRMNVPIKDFVQTQLAATTAPVMTVSTAVVTTVQMAMSVLTLTLEPPTAWKITTGIQTNVTQKPFALTHSVITTAHVTKVSTVTDSTVPTAMNVVICQLAWLPEQKTLSLIATCVAKMEHAQTLGETIIVPVTKDSKEMVLTVPTSMNVNVVLMSVISKVTEPGATTPLVAMNAIAMTVTMVMDSTVLTLTSAEWFATRKSVDMRALMPALTETNACMPAGQNARAQQKLVCS